MNFGIATLGLISLRKDTSHKSEMVSQLLFGETYTVIQNQESWLLVQCDFDGYQGWIDISQHQALSPKDQQSVIESESGIALDMAHHVSSTHRSIPIPAGSSLPGFDGLNFRVAKEKFIYNGQAVSFEGRTPAILERVALRYLNSPYLWGGRSHFGIDCSGFTQVVFKCAGISLLRDAYQQVGQGEPVHFMEEARLGDIAFFCNDDGQIIHVGIILAGGKIIHASGRVRIDKLDHFGIFNTELKKYSHHLKIIKRVF